MKVKLLAALPSDFARKFTTLCSRSWVRVMCERLPTALEDGGSGSTREEAHEDGYHSPSLDDIPLMRKLGRAVCYLHDLPPVVVTHNCNHGAGSAPEQEALRCTTERSALRSLHSQRGGNWWRRQWAHWRELVLALASSRTPSSASPTMREPRSSSVPRQATVRPAQPRGQRHCGPLLVL